MFNPKEKTFPQGGDVFTLTTLSASNAIYRYESFYRNWTPPIGGTFEVRAVNKKTGRVAIDDVKTHLGHVIHILDWEASHVQS